MTQTPPLRFVVDLSWQRVVQPIRNKSKRMEFALVATDGAIAWHTDTHTGDVCMYVVVDWTKSTRTVVLRPSGYMARPTDLLSAAYPGQQLLIVEWGFHPTHAT